MKVSLPPAQQDAINSALASSATMGSIEGWDQLKEAAATLKYDASRQQLVKFMFDAPPERLPQIVAALRIGSVMCKAVRNEIDVARVIARN